MTDQRADADHDRDVLVRIGRNLRAERVRRELTQEAVARLAGMAPTQVARMERGETDSGVSKYLRIAGAIGIGPADLFYGIDLRLESDDRRSSTSPGGRP